MDNEEQKKTSARLTRSEFLKLFIGGSSLAFLGSILYPVVKFLIPPEESESEPETLKLGTTREFPPGSGKIFKFGKKPIILVHSKEGKFLAFSAVCTHLDCIVQYRDDMGSIWCACHNGKYDLSGRNISGPPPKPLQQFVVKIIHDEVFVARA